MLSIKKVASSIILASLLSGTAYAQYSEFSGRNDYNQNQSSRYDLESDAKRKSRRLQRAVERRADTLSVDELVRLNRTLDRAQRILRGNTDRPGPGPGPIGPRPPAPPRYNLTCLRGSNGRYYPHKDGQIFVSSSYNASFSSVQDCLQTLPQNFDQHNCYKQSNGRYYLSNPLTGEIVGSNSYNASFSSLSSCRTDVPAYGVKYACLKQSNGRYYLANPLTAAILGGTSYNESFSSKASCEADMPGDYDTLFCKKQNNGRYYPTRTSDWSIVGPTSYNASYSSKKSCDDDLRYRNY